MKKKLLSIALVLMLLLSLVPSMALADGLYVSVGGKTFTAYGQTMNIGGGTATLDNSGEFAVLRLDNVKLTSFEEMENEEGTVYKCGIVIQGDRKVVVRSNGYNSITAPNDKSDAVYEGIYADSRTFDFKDGLQLDFFGLDVGIDSYVDTSVESSTLNFYNCDLSVLTYDQWFTVGDKSTVNISGNGSIGISAGIVLVKETAALNIKLYGEGQPARYGIYANSATFAGAGNIDVSIKNVPEQDGGVVNAVCTIYEMGVGGSVHSCLKANVSAENCPAAVACAIVADTFESYSPSSFFDQNGFCYMGTLDAKVSVSGGHLLAQALICNSLKWGGTLKAQVTGASEDDCAIVVVNDFTIHADWTPYLYASVDAQNSNNGAIVLPKMGDYTDREPNEIKNQNNSLFITQPSNVQIKDIIEDGVDYQIVVDENGAPVNCVYGNSEGYKFTDITTLNDSYKAAIAWASDAGVTGGYSDFTFRPQNTCTRAQVVTFIWRANGCPEPAGTAAGFNDVPESAYYYKAVLWAAEQGITSGFDDGGFHPDETVTRAQAMTFIWRAENKPAAPEGTVNEFVDVSEANYYYDAVLWAVANGITGGYNNTLFGSNDGCTRAQIVTFLHRNMA